MSECAVSGIGSPSANLSDPCICNAHIGTIYVNETTEDIYIRTDYSTPCNASDWTLFCNFCTALTADEISYDDTANAIDPLCAGFFNGTTVREALDSGACGLRTIGAVSRPWSKLGLGQLQNNDSILISDIIYHTGRTIIGSSAQNEPNAVLEVLGSVVMGSKTTHDNNGTNCTIASGELNTIAAILNSIISAGKSNTIATGAGNAFIGAGEANSTDSDFTAIVAGKTNLIQTSSDYSIIGAGENNQIIGGATRAGIFAGSGNIVNGSGDSGGIFAGVNNQISGIQSAILAGLANVQNASRSAIVAGQNHLIDSNAFVSAILTGDINVINDGSYNAILNGHDNIIDDGDSNLIGGNDNTLTGTGGHVTIFGTLNSVTHSGGFHWQSNNVGAFASAANNEFAMRAAGGIRFYTNAGGTTGMTMAAGASAWVAVSSELVKDNWKELNPEQIIAGIKQLNFGTFQYKKDLHSDDTYDTINIGTTAEQWENAFAGILSPQFVPYFETINGEVIQKDLKGISTGDQLNIAYVAIQYLLNKVEHLENESRYIRTIS